MLRWDWNASIGEVTEVKKGVDDYSYYTYTLYKGNAFMIALAQYDYQEDGTFTWSMHSFWCDKDHMKNCFGVGKDSYDGNIYSNTVLKFRFNKNANKKDIKDLLEVMLKAEQEFRITYYAD